MFKKLAKLKLFVILSAGLPVVLFLTSHQTLASACPASCGVVICLSSLDNGESPTSFCGSFRSQYFQIAIYDITGFNAVATSKVRETFLRTCPTANSSRISNITQTYGMLIIDPGY